MTRLILFPLILSICACGSPRAIGQTDDPRIHAGMTPTEVCAIWGAALTVEIRKGGTRHMTYRSESKQEWTALSTVHEHWADYDTADRVIRWH